MYAEEFEQIGRKGILPLRHGQEGHQFFGLITETEILGFFAFIIEAGTKHGKRIVGGRGVERPSQPITLAATLQPFTRAGYLHAAPSSRITRSRTVGPGLEHRHGKPATEHQIEQRKALVRIVGTGHTHRLKRGNAEEFGVAVFQRGEEDGRESFAHHRHARIVEFHSAGRCKFQRPTLLLQFGERHIYAGRVVTEKVENDVAGQQVRHLAERVFQHSPVTQRERLGWVELHFFRHEMDAGIGDEMFHDWSFIKKLSGVTPG